MKAIQFHEAGGPEVLRYDEVPVPGVGPGEVLVRVHTAGVNPPDWYLREGMKVMPAETRPALELSRAAEYREGEPRTATAFGIGIGIGEVPYSAVEPRLAAEVERGTTRPTVATVHRLRDDLINQV